MKLTRFTDYSLRVLMYIGLQNTGRVTIREISDAYRVSRNHLMKVVSNLSRLGYVAARRGPGGGISLAKPADEINLADVIRDMEEDLDLVECFCPKGKCVITPACNLRPILQHALKAYLQSLEKHTLQDLLEDGSKLEIILGIKQEAA